MAYHIYFVADPTNGPTHGQKCGKSSTLYFKSEGFNDGDPSPPFEIKFETAILTNYNKSQSDSPKGASGVNARTWASTKVGNRHRIKIVLKGSSHPPAGYKYDVSISGKTWDPRVVPR
jgi:hypothetical protein